MVILGIGDYITCGSTVLVDGRLRAAVSDEHLLQDEMACGVPRRSIRRVLDLSGLAPADVDAVAVATIDQHLVPDYRSFRNGWFGQERSHFKEILFEAGSRLARFRDSLPGLERGYYLIRQPAYAHRRRRVRRILKGDLGVSAPVIFVDHHYAHAAAAYYSSPLEGDATVLTVDGGADRTSAKAFSAEDGHLVEATSVPAFDSVGNLYASATELAGFDGGKHEDVMEDLSALGEPVYRDALDTLLTYEDGGFRNCGRVFYRSALRRLGELLPEDFDRADLAASVQRHVEDLVTHFARDWILRTGHPEVALAGEVFGNGRLARRIRELPEVRRCFVFPAPSDRGIGAGAALALEHRRNPLANPDASRLEDVYLGPGLTDGEISRALSARSFTARASDDPEERAAALLADGWVVARCSGRMAYAPRSLGNRTVLCPPTGPSAPLHVNRILERPAFLDLVPAVLAEEAERCFRGLEGAVDAARYGTMAFECTDWLRRTYPGVSSPDGTARPHLVRRKDNPDFHRLLKAYRRRTGCPILLCADLREEDRPIACSAEDALRAFRRLGLPYLAIGSFLVRNPAEAPAVDAASEDPEGRIRAPSAS